MTWQPLSTKPREIKVFWGWNSLDGVQLFTKGLGSDDWWLTDGNRSWAPPEQWQPFVAPSAPEGKVQ